MARLPLVELADAPAPVREALEALPVQLNVFRMMAHAETCFRPLMRLGGAILSQQKLDARLRELIILEVAARSGSRYEWIQHVPIGKATGISDAQIEALEVRKTDADCFDAVDQLVLRFTAQVIERVKASGEIFAATPVTERSWRPRACPTKSVAISSCRSASTMPCGSIAMSTCTSGTCANATARCRTAAEECSSLSCTAPTASALRRSPRRDSCGCGANHRANRSWLG